MFDVVAARKVGLGKSYSGFRLSLILRAARPCRENSDAVMRRHHCIRSIDLWIVEGWFVDAAFEIVGHHQAWAALEKLEHPHMRSDPVRQCLGPGHLGVGVARRTQHRDEDLGLTYFAG